jgi:hypothetical protein
VNPAWRFSLSSNFRLTFGQAESDASLIHCSKTSIEGAQDNRCYYSAALSQRSDHLIVSENPLVSFLALFAALFSIKVLSGFFLFCFLLSLPLLILAAPYIRV